jgi:hypothetical protein
MKQRLTAALILTGCIVVALGMLPFGCARRKDSQAIPASLNQSDLSAVVNYYAQSGKPFDPKGKWPLLSTATARETDRESWERSQAVSTDSATFSSMEILGEETRDGNQYGLVSVTEVSPSEGCKEVSTQTWVKEQGKWRRLLLPETERLADRKLSDGDYQGALKAARDWLQIDPFSERAYSDELFALERGGGSLGESLQRIGPSIVRSLLSGNPKSSTTLFSAVTFAGNSDAAEAMLERIPPDDCDRSQAVSNVAADIKDPRQRLKFLEAHRQGDVGALCSMIWTLTELKRYAEVRPLVTDDASSAIRNRLDAGDATFGAHWAAIIGTALLKAGDKQKANVWAEYGLTRDPTNSEIGRLVKAVKSSR